MGLLEERAWSTGEESWVYWRREPGLLKEKGTFPFVAFRLAEVKSVATSVGLALRETEM